MGEINKKHRRMRFAAYLALVGAAAATRMTAPPQVNAMAELDDEALVDILENEEVSKCADPGIQAAIDFWQSKVDAGKNWGWYYPTFNTWVGKKCVEAGVAEAECPSDDDLKTIWATCKQFKTYDRRWGNCMKCKNKDIIVALKASSLC